LTDPPSRLFAWTAAQRGFAPKEALERALAQRPESAPIQSPGEWLVGRGLLTAEQAAEVERSLRGSSDAGTVIEAGPSASRVASAAAATQPAATRPAVSAGRFGKYELIEELGRGGMGVVYRAFDHELGREVALKTALIGSGHDRQSVERLLREARTAAALSHPAIVPIHDVGEIEGVPYFAMAFVSGRTLERALRAEPAPPVRDRVRWIAEVARAVAHAHAARVVHRDLKPANVLVDDHGGIHVMDFGLAKRLDEGAPLTVTGQMLGTPQYMPPEQIEGERDRIGPPSDVYALGAMLYEALTGRPPFLGATMGETLMKALAQEPVPPRQLDAGIHADLETLCLRALEKDPARRFPEAGGLADELDRWLRGEAIQAQPARWATVVGRHLSRHRWRFALAATLLFAGVWGGWTAWGGSGLRAQIRTDLRRKSGEILGTFLDLRRQGLPMATLERDLLPRLQRAVDHAQRVEPGRAEPAYLLGRVRRALMDWDQALLQQEQALAAEPGFAPARYERAILLARKLTGRRAALLQRAMREAGANLARAAEPLRASTAPAMALPTTDVLEAADPEARSLRARLLEDLQALERGAAKDPGPSAALDPARLDPARHDPARLDPARLACVRGYTLACGSGGHDARAAARRVLREAHEADPSLEEAIEGWAAVEEAERDWPAALAVYDRGIAADAGYHPFFHGRGTVHFQMGAARAALGEDPVPSFAAAERDYACAIALAPGLRDSGIQTIKLRSHWADWLESRGRDAEEMHARAATEADRVLAGAPDDPEARTERGLSRMKWALCRRNHGGDAKPLLADAEADLARALELNPADGQTWAVLAAVRGNRANLRSRRGEDPDPDYRLALEAAKEALARNPNLGQGWSILGQIRSSWAAATARRSGDCESLYGDAADDLARAADLDPGDPGLRVALADLLLNWGLQRARTGGDPVDLYARAEAIGKRLLERNAGDREALESLALVHLNWGTWIKEHDQDPGEPYRAALTELDRALEINPSSFDARLRRGAVHINLGGWMLDHGGDAEALFREAVEDFRRASEVNPTHPEPWTHGGFAWLRIAARVQNRDADASAEFQEAENWLAKGRELGPNLPEAFVRSGELESFLFLRAQKRGEDVAPPALRGYRVLARAIELDPGSADAHQFRGHLHYLRQLWAQALADYDRTVELRPRSAAQVDNLRVQARREVARIAAFPPELAMLQSAGDSLKLGEYARSRREFEEYLAMAEAVATRTPAERGNLFPDRYVELANFNLACVLAVLSSGRSNPIAEPAPLPPGEARALRDQSFARLEASLAFGRKPQAEVALDPDLVLLKEDPRWDKVLARLR